MPGFPSGVQNGSPKEVLVCDWLRPRSGDGFRDGGPKRRSKMTTFGGPISPSECQMVLRHLTALPAGSRGPYRHPTPHAPIEVSGCVRTWNRSLYSTSDGPRMGPESTRFGVSGSKTWVDFLQTGRKWVPKVVQNGPFPGSQFGHMGWWSCHT